MPTTCDYLIASAIDFDCEDMSVRGMEADGVIINREDVDFANCVLDSSNPNIVKTLAIKTGKSGFAIKQLGNTPFSGLVSNLNIGTYKNTWTHEIPIAVLADDPDTAKDILDPMSNGTFVLVLKTKMHGDAKYKIFGYAQGCRASAGTNDKWSEDTEGGFLMTLQEQNAPKSGMYFYNTDEATTDAAFEALS